MPKKQADALIPERPVYILIDGFSIVYRAYHALASRMPLNVRSTGEPIGAVFGFANMLFKALAEVKPAYWAIAFDRPGPTFRDKMYAAYKAGRPETPDELTKQLARVRQLADAFGIPVLEMDGYEADDIIGTLARKATQEGMDTVILSGDTDMVQLVSPHVRIRYPSGIGDTKVYDVQAVRERYGLEPSQMVDFKALKGDPSDNIPSVPGIGEKTAARLLQQFGPIEELYRRIEEVEPARIRDLLREHEETVRRNQGLVAIVTDMPIQFDFQQARADRYDRARVVELFQELEFTSLIGRLPLARQGGKGTPPEAGVELQELEYTTVETDAALDSLIQELSTARRFAMDIESTSQQAMRGELVGLAFAIAPGRAFYLPVGHLSGRQVERERALALLRPLLEDPNIEKVAHDGKFDTLALANEGIALRGLTADVAIAAHLLGAKSVALKAQAFERLGAELPPLSDILGTGSKQISMAQAPIGPAAEYACACADLAGRLWPIYEEELRREELLSLFADVEMALLPVLAKMERHGVAIDVGRLHQMSRELHTRLQDLEVAAYNGVGHIFNINSPQQLAHVLFEELHLPKSKRTKTGYSTDAQVLEGLRETHLVIDVVLAYREVSKLKSTYVDALPELVNPRTGRLHTTFSQTVAATGRLSSSDPNLQNIPVRTELGNRVREAFIAEGAPGWSLLSADYSQIELRILAHMTLDPGLVDAFGRDEDIHASTASQVFNVPLQEVSLDQRRFAKVVNFGLLYGMSEFGLAVRSDRSREEAAPIIEEYFRKYPGIRRYLDDTKRMAGEQGYVQTLLGRRRYVPEVHAANMQVRSAAERMAINMPIQGTAADIIKIAMVRLQRSMEEMGLHSRMVLQVHDELIFEVPEEEMEALKGLVQDTMPRAMELSVPLKVDLKQGLTWGEMG